jgi:hypothetical protein
MGISGPVLRALGLTLRKVLDEAKAKGWTVIDMKNDWKHIFAFEKYRSDQAI